MASIKFTKYEDGIQAWFETVTSRRAMIPDYLNRVVYPRYQRAQEERWMTENASQGDQWPPLSPAYARRKKIIFGGGPKHTWVGGRGDGRPWQLSGSWPTFPGAGNAMMIGTGKMVDAVLNRGEGTLKLITDEEMTVGIEDSVVPYGKYAAEDRPFMTFTDDTITGLLDGLASYAMGVR